MLLLSLFYAAQNVYCLKQSEKNSFQIVHCLCAQKKISIRVLSQCVRFFFNFLLNFAIVSEQFSEYMCVFKISWWFCFVCDGKYYVRFDVYMVLNVIHLLGFN